MLDIREIEKLARKHLNHESYPEISEGNFITLKTMKTKRKHNYLKFNTDYLIASKYTT